MQENFEYSAFISYKREDEKWAIWLQNNLERYSIPSAIRKEIPRLPKRIKPIFRDKTDLSSGGLSSSLRKELERSHFLIVICSPNSASSDWVGLEIEHFRELGREDKIIPVIVDGIPHSENSESECFHPVFNKFSDEPLGINVNYSWILCIVSSLCLILATIFLFIILIPKIISILKAHKHNRIRILKDSIGAIVGCLVGITWLIFVIYYMLDEGWIIYSNPL